MTAEEYIKNNWGENWLSVDWTAGDVVDALEEFAKMQLAGQSKMPSEEEAIDMALDYVRHKDLKPANRGLIKDAIIIGINMVRNRMEESK